MSTCPHHGKYTTVFCIPCHTPKPDSKAVVRAKYPQFRHYSDAELAETLRQQVQTLMAPYKDSGPPSEGSDWSAIYKAWERRDDAKVLDE